MSNVEIGIASIAIINAIFLDIMYKKHRKLQDRYDKLMKESRQ